MSFLDWFKPRRGRGWLPDPEDARDIALNALGLAVSFPVAASVSHPAVTPRNQGGTESCVGFAVAQALELAYLQQGIRTGDLSPRFVYFLSRILHGAAGIDSGTYVRTAIKAVRRHGAASESTCPFSSWRINQSPPFAAYGDGYKRRGLRGYYTITGTRNQRRDGCKRAIANGMPVVGGWQVDDAFTKVRGDTLISRVTGPSLGGHAMVLQGYRGDEFNLMNSWGTGWGNRGCARVTSGFVSDASVLWALDVRP